MNLITILEAMLLFIVQLTNILLITNAPLFVKPLVSSPSDMLLIRHGRSRVRHSNEKDYIRWGLKALDNLTLDYDVTDTYDNDTLIILGNDIWFLDNSTFLNQSNTSNLAYGLHSKISEEKITPSLPVNSAGTISAPRKTFKKKKVMDSIRKNVNKGLEYLRTHTELDSLSYEYQNDIASSSSNFEKSERERETAADITTEYSMSESSLYEELPHSIPARLSVPYTQQLLNKHDGKNSNTRNVSYVNLSTDDDAEDSSNIDILLSKKSADGNNTETDSIEDYVLGNIFGTTDEDLSDLDEISRKNRMNLLRGRDIVTKFLQIVESQHLLGANCTAGTALNLGEGVVDQYAQDRFRIEAEVAVNRANMLTRIFKQTSPSVQASEHLLHASVLSMVEFDDDIFAAGNCFDWNQHPSKSGLFCPFAYRLPPPDQGAAFAKDLAAEYHYLGNTSEWFFLARKNAEKVISRNDQYTKSYHYYSNSTAREADIILTVKYDDGRWSKPYYDCGGGNIWMLTYTVPFFGYENGTYFFKGTSGIDIDLRRVDIDQCPQKNTLDLSQPLNIFAGTDKCKQRTTMCEPIAGLGFRRGSYKCLCRRGFYFPDTAVLQKYFNGSILEEEYEKLMLGEPSTYNKPMSYECLPCAEGCDFCEDSSPCVAALNWPMRTSILVLACAIIGFLPPAAWFTFRYQQIKVVRAASPALLRVIALGAFFIYCTTIVMYPPPSLYTCTARIWLREIGFSLTYGALMLKTWRISVIFRVRSAKAVKITDAALLKRLGMICVFVGVCLLIRTVMSPPEVVVGRTANDLKAFLCKTDWWDYTFTSMEVLFLTWGVRLCIMVRKAPSEFNESRFISMAIYNEFLLTCFLNVSMLFLQSPANPDLLYIIFFCHTQLTVTLLLALIFGSKVYIVLRSGRSQDNTIGLGQKSSTAKFTFRPQVKNLANPSTATSSTAQLAEIKLTDQEALEEIRQLSMQLRKIQDLAPPRGVAVVTITSLLDSLKTSSQPLTLNASSSNSVTLPTLDYDPQKFIKSVTTLDKSVNTQISGDEFWHYLDFEYMERHHLFKRHKCQTVAESVDCVCSPQQTDKEKCDLSFSELYLECMCAEAAEEFDINSEYGRHQKFDQSCHVNIIASSSHSRVQKDTSCKNSPQLLICDKCKKDYVNISPNDIDLRLGRRKYTADNSNCNQTYDDADDVNTQHLDNESGNNLSSNVQAKSDRKSDKMVIDLNDKSKYTKEVSV